MLWCGYNDSFQGLPKAKAFLNHKAEATAEHPFSEDLEIRAVSSLYMAMPQSSGWREGWTSHKAVSRIAYLIAARGGNFGVGMLH